jgi:hypothetical protein
MNDVYGEAGSLPQALGQLLRHHDRAMPAAGAANANRQVAFAFALEARQAKFEQLSRGF